MILALQRPTQDFSSVLPSGKCFTTLSVEVTAISIAKLSTTFLQHFSKRSLLFVSKHQNLIILFICVFTSSGNNRAFQEESTNICLCMMKLSVLLS